jgi:hypothetical protein
MRRTEDRISDRLATPSAALVPIAMNDPLHMADLTWGMPVLVYRPGVNGSRVEILVQTDFSVAHLRDCGLEFARVSRRIVWRDGQYVMEQGRP